MTKSLMEDFFHQAKEGMYTSTPEGRFLKVNKSFCRLLGYTQEELLSQPVENILALPQERRRFRHEIENNGAVSGFRVRLLAKGRVELLCQIDAVALRDEGGGLKTYVGIVRPRWGTSSPESREVPFSLALRGSGEGHWEWTLKRGRFQFSDRWGALLGYGPGELDEKVETWFGRIHPEDFLNFKRNLQGVLKNETPSLSCYFRMKHRGGDYLWMQVRGLAEVDEEGTVTRLGGSLASVQNHLTLYEKLKTQEAKLEHQAEALSRDKSLLAQYFSGDMLSFVMAGEGPRINPSLTQTVVGHLQLEGVEDLAARSAPGIFSEGLNEVLTDVMDLVYGQGGSVVKILGDSLILAFSPLDGEEAPVDAALVWAKEVFGWLKTFNDVRPPLFKDPLRLSLGLSRGPVIMGSFGSIHRLEYTLVGKPLTRARQLQALARSRGLKCLVDGSIQTAGQGVDGLPPGVLCPFV